MPFPSIEFTALEYLRLHRYLRKIITGVYLQYFQDNRISNVKGFFVRKMFYSSEQKEACPDRDTTFHSFKLGLLRIDQQSFIILFSFDKLNDTIVLNWYINTYSEQTIQSESEE